MTKPKIGRWPKVGSIIEFVTYKGLAYAQVTHLDTNPYGDLIRIFKGFYDERPQEFSEMAKQPHHYHTFFNINSAIRDKLCRLVVHEAIPPFAQSMPHFRDQERSDGRWWMIDSQGEDYVAGPLTNEQTHYPIYALPSPHLVVSRIEKEWSPYWQYHLEIGEVKCTKDPFFYGQPKQTYGTPPAHAPFSLKPDLRFKCNSHFPYFSSIRVRCKRAPYYTIKLGDRGSGVFFEAYSKAGKLDVMHISSDISKKTFEIFWSKDGQHAALTIDGICHAVYDFENKKGYCHSQFPKPIESSPFSRPEWSDECLKLFL